MQQPKFYGEEDVLSHFGEKMEVLPIFMEKNEGVFLHLAGEELEFRTSFNIYKNWMGSPVQLLYIKKKKKDGKSTNFVNQ